MLSAYDISRALEYLRGVVDWSTPRLGPVTNVEELLTLAAMRTCAFDGPDREAHRIAAWIIADEAGVLTAHQRLSLRKSLRDAGLHVLLDEQEPAR